LFDYWKDLEKDLSSNYNQIVFVNCKFYKYAKNFLLLWEMESTCLLYERNTENASHHWHRKRIRLIFATLRKPFPVPWWTIPWVDCGLDLHGFWVEHGYKCFHF
jgi:hypothetical protein